MSSKSASSTRNSVDPALVNLAARDDVSGLARLRARTYTTRTVRTSLQEEYILKGWTIDRANKETVRLKKDKDHGSLLEDRVWMLMYNMGFLYLHGERKALLRIGAAADSPITEIDVAAVDAEVAIAIECKSSDKPKRRPEFQEELGKHVLARQWFTKAINQQYSDILFKRAIGFVMFLNNVDLSENDRKRAEAENVVLFDERDLAYYEMLIVHLGSAAKYQFLADVFSGKQIPGLSIRVAAIKARMSGIPCYTFSVPPDYQDSLYISSR